MGGLLEQERHKQVWNARVRTPLMGGLFEVGSGTTTIGIPTQVRDVAYTLTNNEAD